MSQGDIALLDDPVARQLLQSATPVRFAYVSRDGTPRVVPLWFHWNGREFILGTFGTAPKAHVLENNSPVAFTIDGNQFPYKVLLVRGTVTVEPTDSVVPEYALMARRYLGDNADSFLEQVRAMLPGMRGMLRIAVTPSWVGILDFEQRFPSAMERAMTAAVA